jgi:hypothetical protein
MSVRFWRFTTLLLCALTLALGVCHLLQMPPRMGYDSPLWLTTMSCSLPLSALCLAKHNSSGQMIPISPDAVPDGDRA